MAVNAAHRNLIDDPIARVRHIIDVCLKVGYTEQPCIVESGQRPERPGPHPDGTHTIAATIPIKAAPNVLLRSKLSTIAGRRGEGDGGEKR